MILGEDKFSMVVNAHPANINALISNAMSKLDFDKLPRSTIVVIKRNKIIIRKK